MKYIKTFEGLNKKTVDPNKKYVFKFDDKFLIGKNRYS